MRKNIIFSLVLTACVIVLSFACIKTEVSYKPVAESKNGGVLTVAKTNVSDNKVLETRFLNMLNHNFVYDGAFYDDAALVEDSLLALLDVAEDSYVKETYVNDYIFNMYGKIYNDFGFLGEVMTEKDGYVYILPRGYDEYNHKIVSITDNKDGSFTVVTNVEISALDGSIESLECETVFLKAEDSAFGYNIVYSEIDEGLIGDADC